MDTEEEACSDERGVSMRELSLERSEAESSNCFGMKWVSRDDPASELAAPTFSRLKWLGGGGLRRVEGC